MIVKYTSLSGNIAVWVITIFYRSLKTNLKNESLQFFAIHPFNLVTATRKKSCSVRKCMVHITNRRWSVQPLHLVVLTRFPRWYYKKLLVISTRKILLNTILTTRFLVTVPRNFSQCRVAYSKIPEEIKCVAGIDGRSIIFVAGGHRRRTMTMMTMMTTMTTRRRNNFVVLERRFVLTFGYLYM